MAMRAWDFSPGCATAHDPIGCGPQTPSNPNDHPPTDKRKCLYDASPIRDRSRVADPTVSKIERPTPAGANAPGFGSDVIADALRSLDVPYIALTPGASYRGLHD